MVKFVSILFLFAVTLMIYSTGHFESCSCETEEDDHHDPVCDDNSCIFCSAGFVGINMPTQSFNHSFNDFRPYSLSDKIIKYGEFVTDLDQPPRA